MSQLSEPIVEQLSLFPAEATCPCSCHKGEAKHVTPCYCERSAIACEICGTQAPHHHSSCSRGMDTGVVT